MNYVTLALEKQTFANKSEMDETIKSHIAEHGADLPDTAIEILRLLSRYACKYPGVAFLKNGTIAKLIGKSRITVIRNINKLINAGIIEKVSVMREINGGNGSNMYVILPTVTPEEIHRTNSYKPAESVVTAAQLPTEPISLINYNYSISYTYKKSRLAPPYKRFKEFVEQFIGKGQKAVINRLYGVYLGNTKALRKAYEDNELIDVALRALGVTFSAIKRIEVRNIAGYFHGVLNKLLDEMYEELIYGIFDL